MLPRPRAWSGNSGKDTVPYSRNGHDKLTHVNTRHDAEHNIYSVTFCSPITSGYMYRHKAYNSIVGNDAMVTCTEVSMNEK